MFVFAIDVTLKCLTCLRKQCSQMEDVEEINKKQKNIQWSRKEEDATLITKKIDIAEGPNAEPEINHIDLVDIEIEADFFKKHTEHIDDAIEKHMAPQKSNNDIMKNKEVYENKNEKDVTGPETKICQSMIKKQCSMNNATEENYNCNLKNDITHDFNSELIIDHIENKDKNDKITRIKANPLPKEKKRKKLPDDTGQGLKFGSGIFHDTIYQKI